MIPKNSTKDEVICSFKECYTYSGRANIFSAIASILGLELILLELALQLHLLQYFLHGFLKDDFIIFLLNRILYAKR